MILPTIPVCTVIVYTIVQYVFIVPVVSWSTTTTTTSSSSLCFSTIRSHNYLQQRQQQQQQQLKSCTRISFVHTTNNNDKRTSSLILYSMARNINDPEYTIPKYPLPRQIEKDQEILLGDLTGGRPGAIVESEEQLLIKEQMFIEIDNGVRSYNTEQMNDYGILEDDDESEYEAIGTSTSFTSSSTSIGGDDTSDSTTSNNNLDNLLDAETLASWTIQELKSKFDYEWDPNSNEPDPNIVEMNIPNKLYVQENPMDLQDNVEIGYDPMFGPSNPIDKRTILGAIDSYMIDDRTRDDSMLTPQFNTDDIEIQYNSDVVTFRKSLIDIIETYDDPFLKQQYELEQQQQLNVLSNTKTNKKTKTDDDSTNDNYLNYVVPRHVAKWYGYPEQTFLEPKNFTNNRYTKEEDRTNFDIMTPYNARIKAIELARSKNAEWLVDGISQQYHTNQRLPYEHYNTLIGTVREGYCNPTIVSIIRPVLQILGSCVKLLSITEVSDDNSSTTSETSTTKLAKVTTTTNDNDDEVTTTTTSTDKNYSNTIVIIRFEYYGLMKNKYGMKCWTESMIQNDCLLNKASIIFESGFRKRDPIYDGGDHWNGPHN